MQELHVPAQVRTVLVQAGTAGFAGFAVLGLFTAVSPTVLQLLGHNDPALTGLVVFSVFVASAAGQRLLQVFSSSGKRAGTVANEIGK